MKIGKVILAALTISFGMACTTAAFADYREEQRRIRREIEEERKIDRRIEREEREHRRWLEEKEMKERLFDHELDRRGCVRSGTGPIYCSPRSDLRTPAQGEVLAAAESSSQNSEAWSQIVANAEARLEQALGRRLSDTEFDSIVASVKRGIESRNQPKAHLASADTKDWKKLPMACVHVSAHVMILASVGLLCYAWETEEIYGLYTVGMTIPVPSASLGGGLLVVTHAPDAKASGDFMCLNLAAASKFMGARITACRDGNMFTSHPEQRGFVYMAYQAGIGTDSGVQFKTTLERLY